MPRARLFAAAVVLLASTLAPGRAQATSIFSLFFYGERIPRGDARSRALGYNDLALADTRGALVGNPARLAFLEETKLTTMVTTGVAKASDEQNTYQNGFTDFPAAQVGVPLGKGIVVGVGYQVLNSPGGEIALDEETSEGEPYVREFQKGGSLFAVPFTLAAGLGSRGALGLTYLMQKGSVRETWSLDFEDVTYVTGRTEYEESYSGGTVEVGGWVRPLDRLSLAFLFRAGYDADVDVVQTFSSSLADSMSGRTDHFPPLLGAGLAFSPGDRWTLAFQYLSQNWEEYEGRHFWETKTHREQSLHFGLERLAGEGEGSTLGRIPLRLGYAFREWPVTQPPGHVVRGHALTAGTGFSFAGGRGVVDVSLEYLHLGSRGENGLVEDQFRFSVSFSGGEPWGR
jgi:hypothetical protein